MNELGVEDQLGIFNTRSPGGELGANIHSSRCATAALRNVSSRCAKWCYGTLRQCSRRAA